jgi:hypothetical protein
MVSFKCQQDKSLGQWFDKQRNSHDNDNLRFDRKRLLDEIWFVWKGKGWHQQHEKLVEFKRKHGHCAVPRGCKQDKSLGDWVNKQRTSHKNNKIRPDQKTILDEIGFTSKAERSLNFIQQDKLWHQQHEKLVVFKRKKANAWCHASMSKTSL